MMSCISCLLPFLCAFCAFSWPVLLLCYFLRLLFLTAFLPPTPLEGLAFLTGFLAAFTFTGFFTGFLAAFFATFFFAAFFAGLAAFFLAGFATSVTAAGSSASAGSASAASISRQPWASRTAIMADNMSFQVCCCLITSLGNMQPSQQI